MLHHIPRLTVTAHNNDLKAGAKLVVEYFTSGGKDKTSIQRAQVEQIPLPEMAKGQTVTLDGTGMEINAPRAGARKESETFEFFGLIISLFSPDGTLLM